LYITPYPVTRVLIPGDEKHCILHGAGKVELVDFAENRKQLPFGMILIHALAHRLHARIEFTYGHSVKHLFLLLFSVCLRLNACV
jgi:hypothetical protein